MYRLNDAVYIISMILLLGLFLVSMLVYYGVIDIVLHPSVKFNNRDYVKDGDIWISEHNFTVNYKGELVYSRVAGTGSMFPLLPPNCTVILTTPSIDDLVEGDIITYEDGNETIIHYIHSIGEDKEGKYFKTKGYNNFEYDGKIRMNQVRYVMIGVVY